MARAIVATVASLLAVSGCVYPDHDLVSRLRDLESRIESMPGVHEVTWHYDEDFFNGGGSGIGVVAASTATATEISAVVEALRSGLAGSSNRPDQMGVGWCAQEEPKNWDQASAAQPCLSLSIYYPIRFDVAEVEAITATGVDLAEAMDGQWTIFLGRPHEDSDLLFQAEAASADMMTVGLERATALVGPQFSTADIDVSYAERGAGALERGEHVTTTAAESSLAAALLTTTRDIADRTPDQSGPADIELTVTPEFVTVRLNVATASDDAVAIAASEVREMLRSSGREFSLRVSGSADATFVIVSGDDEPCREETTVPGWCEG